MTVIAMAGMTEAGTDTLIGAVAGAKTLNGRITASVLATEAARPLSVNDWPVELGKWQPWSAHEDRSTTSHSGGPPYRQSGGSVDD